MWVLGARAKRHVLAGLTLLVVWFESTAHSADAPSALASWVPPEVLALALLFVCAAQFAQMREDKKERKAKEAELTAAIHKLEADTQGKFDRMGERFDARQQNLMQDVAVLKATQK